MSLAKNVSCLIAASLMALPLSSPAQESKEIKIYEGPVFTSPSDDPILTSRPGEAQHDLKFVREFMVDSGLWHRQFTLTSERLGEPLPLSAEKAIELARASADSGSAGPQKNVTKLELLTRKRDEDQKGDRDYVPFYLIEMNISGSEVQRVVLMDGTVIKSSLRQVKDDVGGK